MNSVSWTCSIFKKTCLVLAYKCWEYRKTHFADNTTILPNLSYSVRFSLLLNHFYSPDRPYADIIIRPRLSLEGTLWSADAWMETKVWLMGLRREEYPRKFHVADGIGAINWMPYLTFKVKPVSKMFVWKTIPCLLWVIANARNMCMVCSVFCD